EGRLVLQSHRWPTHSQSDIHSLARDMHVKKGRRCFIPATSHSRAWIKAQQGNLFDLLFQFFLGCNAVVCAFHLTILVQGWPHNANTSLLRQNLKGVRAKPKGKAPSQSRMSLHVESRGPTDPHPSFPRL